MITHEPSYTDYAPAYSVGQKAGFRKRRDPKFTMGLIGATMIVLAVLFGAWALQKLILG